MLLSKFERREFKPTVPAAICLMALETFKPSFCYICILYSSSFSSSIISILYCSYQLRVISLDLIKRACVSRKGRPLFRMYLEHDIRFPHLNSWSQNIHQPFKLRLLNQLSYVDEQRIPHLPFELVNLL